ncbi:MAG: sulfotransferase [Planctomycetota bacterium]|nr:sulfotransferase [Planctomycetota bacterium]
MTGVRDDAPLLLTGNQRSGTSFTARLLGAHPRAAVGSEDGVIRIATAWFPAMSGPSGAGLRYARFAEFARALETREGERWSGARRRVEEILLAWQRDGKLLELTRAGDVGAFVRALCHSFHCSGRASAPLVWGDKYPEFLFQAEALEAIFSRARWVFVVRRPESNLEALARKLPERHGELGGKAVFTLEHALEQWLEWNGRWLAFRAKLPTERRLEVRYEDWIANPRAVAERLGAFVGLDLLDEPACAQDLERLDPARAERWRASPLVGELARLGRDARVAPLLDAFGYSV